MPYWGGRKMVTVAVTGSKGFIGRNLLEGFSHVPGIEVRSYDFDSTDDLSNIINGVDIIFHLAGVNRPENPEDFARGNTGLTKEIIDILTYLNQHPAIVFTSSAQATLDNPYGKSKKAAEDVLIEYQQRTTAGVYIYRLPGVFGKWSRPDYNTVVATFCHNIARDVEIQISDPDRKLELVYIDDVVKEFVTLLSSDVHTGLNRRDITPVHRISLGQLADELYEFRKMRNTLLIPDFQDRFLQCLYATYLSFLPEEGFSYLTELRTDERGSLSELLKSQQFGQIFVSTTHPGIIRGNHYHNTKTEKFIVIKGKGLIRFRDIRSDQIISYEVNGHQPEIVDIPPGYTHSIENIGVDDMITLFWASQLFDQENPDTYYCEV
jgi:UDP-2-acetamido-2,6-beta-L-arabino-hexul-4-ose reductase